MIRGMTIGKFYPFTKGHEFLNQYASEHVDELWILVCQEKSYEISGKVRAGWIQELFPKAHVIVIPSDHLDDDDSEGWAIYTKQVLGFTPDVVFTSELYGEPYAQFMGCIHVLVDLPRIKFPIWARFVRSDALSHLDMLPGVVRQWFVKKVVLVGAESTGKTTLAERLATEFQTNWVPEYGRLYASGREHNAFRWESNEFVHIAQTHRVLEQILAERANRVIIHDTDAFVTSIWHESYMAHCSAEVESIAHTFEPDLYLVSSTDGVPYIQDGTRNEERRTWMHGRFLEKLHEWGRPYVILSGGYEERFEKACAEIQKLLTPITLSL